MLLAFWYAASLNQSDVYSLIGRTKGELVKKLEEAAGVTENGSPVDKNGWKADYAEPEKRVIIYKDGHELMCMMAGEGGGYANSMTMAQFKVRYPEIYAKQ